MKIYLVTEMSTKDNALLRSWVCFTKDQADECLKYHYDVACTFNRIAGLDDPTNCLEHDFFFWKMTNGMELKYNITETKTFAE